MTILAAAVLTKNGRIVLSRQFVEMTRVRIEGLLAAFPKLVGTTQKQYTMLETSTVRYLYQPIETLFLVIVTTKNSNVVDDLNALRLLGSVVPQFCPNLSEEKIEEKSFDILFAFDEVICQGYSDTIPLEQVMQNLEMESVEEEVAKSLKKKQMEEAAAHAKDKAKALSKVKREGGGGGFGSDFAELNRAMARDADQAAPARPMASQVVEEVRPPPGPVSKGAMVLGKASKKSDVASKVLGESGVAPQVAQAPTTGAPASASNAPTSSDPVDIKVDEKISVTLNRDGGHSNLDVRGNLFMVITDPKYSDVRVLLAPMNQDFAFKTHAFINKNSFGSDNLLALKDAGKCYPTCQTVEVLRWRLQKPDGIKIPLTINCWPSDSSVNVEYELEVKNLVLKDIRIAVPIGGAFPQDVTLDCGQYTHDTVNGVLIWTIPAISSANAEGQMEVNLSQKVNPSSFFPTSVAFTSPVSLAGVKVMDVRASDTGASVSSSISYVLAAEAYNLE